MQPLVDLFILFQILKITTRLKTPTLLHLQLMHIRCCKHLMEPEFFLSEKAI